jgi:glutaredoxin
MEIKHVDGKDRGKVILYALSTCPWCRRTKRLLDKLGVAYDYIDVDLVDDDEKDRIDEEVKQWNPRFSFPTLVINEEKVISGYNPEEIEEALS